MSMMLLPLALIAEAIRMVNGNKKHMPRMPKEN
jgi:hypothetical protein